MKAMILAAGRGERMRPLTDTTPKPLLKVGGQMLIEYHLHKLCAAGVSDVVINHAWLGECIEQALGSGDRYGLKIHYSAESTALETAGGIINALPLLGSEPFIVVNADIYTDYDYSFLPGKLAGKAYLVMVDNPPHHKEGDFAVTEHNIIKATGENKKTFSGIGVYHPVLFAACNKGKQPLAPVLKSAMETNQVYGEYYAGVWSDVGTPERLNELDKQLLIKNNKR